MRGEGLGECEGVEAGFEPQGLDGMPGSPGRRPGGCEATFPPACCVYSYGDSTPVLGLNRGSVGVTAVIGGLPCHGIQWPDEEVDESL